MAPNPFGEGGLAFLPLRLGPEAEGGMLVAVSPQADFPGQTETLLLNVAVNQALIALQEARLRSEQKRVGERARPASGATNRGTCRVQTRNLRREIAERGLAERKLHREEARLKRSEGHKAAILDAALDCVVAIDDEGPNHGIQSGRGTDTRLRSKRRPRQESRGRHHSAVAAGEAPGGICPPSGDRRDERARPPHGDDRASVPTGGKFRSKSRSRVSSRTALPPSPAVCATSRNANATSKPCAKRMRGSRAARNAGGRFSRTPPSASPSRTQNGRFIAANPVYEKMLGYSEEELQQLTSVDITHEEHLEPNAALVAELLAGRRKQFHGGKAVPAQGRQARFGYATTFRSCRAANGCRDS